MVDSKPEGVEPIFLTAATCEIFKVRPNEDVTAENPLCFIPKQKILEDIQTRRAISDFQPFKDRIQSFKKIDSEQEQDAVEEQIIKRGPWISRGSEKEVEEERIISSIRPKLRYLYQRKRREFGSKYTFENVDPEHIKLNITKAPLKNESGNEASQFYRKSLNTGIQSVLEFSDFGSQSLWPSFANEICQYDPIMLEEEKINQILSSEKFNNFIKLAEQRFRISPPPPDHRLDLNLYTNSLCNLFTDAYVDLKREDILIDGDVQLNLKEINSFTDLGKLKNKTLTCLEFHPVENGILATSSVFRRTYDEDLEESVHPPKPYSNLILLWRLSSDIMKPLLVLESPARISCFKFLPQNPNVIVAGTYEGILVIWDIAQFSKNLSSTGDLNSGPTLKSFDSFLVKEKYIKNQNTSLIEQSHKSCVTDVTLIPSDFTLTGTNGVYDIAHNSSSSEAAYLISCSIDGSVLFWEAPKDSNVLNQLDFSWKPLFKCTVQSSDGSFEYSLTKVILPPLSKISEDKDKKKSQIKLLLATEEGEVLQYDWKSEKSETKGIDVSLKKHYGVISDLTLNNLYEDIFITAGNKNFYIWKLGIHAGPIFSYERESGYYLRAIWSKTRHSVFFLGTSEGYVEVWDLLERTDAPLFVQQVTIQAVTCMNFNQVAAMNSSANKGGQISFQLAVGDDAGVIYIFSIPRTLVKFSKAEEAKLQKFFIRGQKRVSEISRIKQREVKKREPKLKLEKGWI